MAEKALSGKGYKRLGARVRVGRRDELDLVMRDGDTLVFVEVKTRASERFGRPLEAIKRDKRRSLSRAAARYMQRLKQKPPYFRFDVVEVVGTPDGDAPEVRHIEHAFPMEGGHRVTW